MKMAFAGSTAGTHVVHNTSSYRVKFKRDEFLRLVEIAKPELIYRTSRFHFFAFDGFVMYTFDCTDEDFRVPILRAIEFSNMAWSG